MQFFFDNFAGLTIFSSYQQLLVIGFIVFLGQFIYSCIGFGSGMVTISLLALLYGDINIFVPLFLLLCLPSEIFISVKDRKNIDFSTVKIFILFIVPTLIIGAYLLKSTPSKGLIVYLGILVAFLGLYYLFFEEKMNFNFNSKFWVFSAASLAGLLGSLYGISGPPLIIYFKSKKMGKRMFRAALMSIFLSMSIVRTLVYGGLGFYTKPLLLSFVLLLPFSFFGLYLGYKAHDYVPEPIFKKITSFILLLSGILLVFKNLY
jgi:uncharacterized membrane protein YfcA